MEFKQITLENIDSEHICCCISDKKGENCVASKKAWMKERIKEGLVFYKLDVRGKVFVEYLPAERAWAPVEAEGYMYIDCFWVSGKYKGQGISNMLLEKCIADSKAKGKKGLVCLSSKKKMPFLSDPSYLKYKGFQTADTAAPFFELLYLPFEKDAEVPKFRETAKHGHTEEMGFVLYYSNQCPHTEKYAPVLMSVLEQEGLPCSVHKIETTEEAQNAPTPCTSYSLFYNGNFITNEILSEKKAQKIAKELVKS